jgi:hypothetical protein
MSLLLNLSGGAICIAACGFAPWTKPIAPHLATRYSLLTSHFSSQ